MNKKGLKIISILTIILIITIICILFGLKKVNTNRTESDKNKSEEKTVEEANIEIDDINLYATIESIIDRYIKYNSEDESIILNVLNSQYIQENKITKENVFSKLEDIQGYPLVIVNYMKKNKLSENIDYIVVNYDMVDNLKDIPQEDLRFEVEEKINSTEKNNCNIVVLLDNENSTYSIIPEYIDENKIKNIEAIEKNENNVYEIKSLTQKEIAQIYMQDLRNKLLYKTKEIYDDLDSATKDNFNDYNSFKEYVEKNKENYKVIGLEKYRIISGEDNNYTECDCIDINGKQYTFKDYGVLNYIVKIDIY